MVQAVASRIAPGRRITKAMAQRAAAEAMRAKALAKQSGAPSSVGSIPTRAAASPEHANAFIRPMGNSRRVYLMDPYLSSNEINGLAHRISVLATNEGINSVLIATDDRDSVADNCLPSYITALDDPSYDGMDFDTEPAPNHTWHVSGGYDAIEFVEVGAHNDPERVEYLLDSIKNLSHATNGRLANTKVPVIALPHGAITDAGYALCMGSYVLATTQTSFSMLNPSRGLSFDPVGLSYILPRLGQEYEQRSGNFRGCGMILALTGFEASAHDMVETGLATHLVRSIGSLPLLEEALAALPAWSGQGLVKKPPHNYGGPRPRDANASMRNVSVAYTIDQLSEYGANPRNDLSIDYFKINSEDPALDISNLPWDTAFFSSDLVDFAVTFDRVFKNEDTLEGLVEAFHEIGSRQTDDPEEMEGIRVAQNFARRMRQQSPLALRVVHQLMMNGARQQENLENCMQREKRAQLKLMQMPDFENWATFAKQHKGKPRIPTFTRWTHKSIAAVTADEVAEIIG